MKRGSICLILLLGLALTACAARQKTQETFTLTILHTNDIHAMYGGLTAEGTPCYGASCENGQGGSVRLEQAVRLIRAQAPASILLDAGDEFQGTLYYSEHKEKVPASLLPYIGYTAMTPGNHEFDEGCEQLLSMARAMDTPVVAANLALPQALEGGNQAKPLIRPWLVVEQQGRRIGIVGLLNPDTKALASPCSDSTFSDPAEALRKAVSALRAQGVNIIIALTHIGIAEDQALARAVDGVDVIVGGHSHTLLSNSDPKAAGPYPVVERSLSGEPVLIVTAAHGGRLLGRLNVAFDGQGRATSWDGEPIPLSDAKVAELAAAGKTTSTPDPELVRRMESYTAPLTSLINQVVGQLEVPDVQDGLPVDTPDALVCRVRECVSGNLITDIMLSKTKNEGAQAALLVGGSIRNPLPAGRLTMGDLLTSMPYENLLVVGDIPGTSLLAMLEHGLSRREEVKGQFLQTSGLHYAFDPALPAGKRLLSAEIRDARTGEYRQVVPGARYRIVICDYMAEGGDAYTMLTSLAWKNTGLRLSDAIRTSLEQKKITRARIEGRIRVQGE